MRMFRKPFRWAAAYTLVLLLSAGLVLLDAFVLPHVGTPVVTALPSPGTTADRASAAATDAAVITDMSYADEHIQIRIDTAYVYNTNVYIADVQVSDVSYLRTALANDVFGRNINEPTSSMAQNNNAVFAVNGDYYGFRTSGYVIRNGVLYRDTAGDHEDLVIDGNGDFSVINEQDRSAQNLLDEGAWQVLSFGPALIVDGAPVVTDDTTSGHVMRRNPRTAIGQVSALHYIVLVTDGRTGSSAGLSLTELTQLFADRGCTVAYNLDGGGSATMWFNGTVVNSPTDGRSDGERSVSDIVYIG